ncbi:MAG TPA: methyltransferase domain-containing protein [Gemmataceae bacterium]|jgi:SAM-dependent methyltransferase|nr:methyltransferase domain-containing protein [Gemmataceae bacterium]
MRILNPAVLHHLESGGKLRLNLGCGMRRLPGYWNVDRVALEGIDVLADLEEPLSQLPDDSVEAIYCRHTLEHVTRLLELLAEIHRVTIPDGKIEAIVPHFSNPYGYSDPTHVRFFGLYSFFYLAADVDQPRRKVPNFYLPQRFRVESVRINLLRTSIADKIVRAVLQPLVNRSVEWQDWYERRLCRTMPADDIHYLLRPVKSTSEAAGPGTMRKAG